MTAIAQAGPRVHPDAVRIALFYTAVFAISGVYTPFWPVFLESRGIGPAEIGTLYAMGLFLRPLTAPVVGFVADRWLGLRRTMTWLAAGTFLSFVAYAPAYGFWWLAGVTFLLMIAWPNMVPLAEALTLRHQRAGRLTYGRVRVWGSVAYIVINLVGGFVLAGLGPWGVLGAAILIASCVFVTTLFLRPAPIPPEEQMIRPTLKELGYILSRPFLMLGLIAAAMTDGAHAAFYGFGTLNWQAEGYSPSVIGFLWASGVCAEVVLLWFAGPWLRRQSGLMFIFVGGVAAVVRWSLMATSPPLWALFIIQNLHALTYGATLLGAMTFITRNVPERYAGSVQGTYSAVDAGLFMAVASVVAGQIFAVHGSLAYVAMAAMGAASALLSGTLLVYRRIYGRKAVSPPHPLLPQTE